MTPSARIVLATVLSLCAAYAASASAAMTGNTFRLPSADAPVTIARPDLAPMQNEALRQAVAEETKRRETPLIVFSPSVGQHAIAVLGPESFAFSDWLRIRRKDGASIANRASAPEECVVTVKQRPRVSENSDGTWSITFER